MCGEFLLLGSLKRQHGLMGTSSFVQISPASHVSVLVELRENTGSSPSSLHMLISKRKLAILKSKVVTLMIQLSYWHHVIRATYLRLSNLHKCHWKLQGKHTIR